MKYIKIKRIFEAEEYKKSLPIVEGDFNCYDKNLYSLKGGPEQVLHGSFLCGYNNLVNLEGGPIRVDKDYVCSSNKLISLKGAPKKIKGDFDCSKNSLQTLNGAPIKVDKIFWALNNNLISLEGGPIEVGGDYHINDSTLFSVKGLPHYLKGKLFLPKHIELSKEDLYIKSKLKNEKELIDWLTSNLNKAKEFKFIKDMLSKKIIKDNSHLLLASEYDLFK